MGEKTEKLVSDYELRGVDNYIRDRMREACNEKGYYTARDIYEWLTEFESKNS